MKKLLMIVAVISMPLSMVQAVPPQTGSMGTGMMSMPNPMPLKRLIDKFVSRQLNDKVVNCMKAYSGNFKVLGRHIRDGINELENQNIADAREKFSQAYGMLAGMDNSVLLQNIKAECPDLNDDVITARSWLKYLDNRLDFIAQQQSNNLTELMMLFQFDRVKTALDKALGNNVQAETEKQEEQDEIEQDEIEQVEQDLEDFKSKQYDPHIIGTPVGTPIAVDGTYMPRQ